MNSNDQGLPLSTSVLASEQTVAVVGWGRMLLYAELCQGSAEVCALHLHKAPHHHEHDIIKHTVNLFKFRCCWKNEPLQFYFEISTLLNRILIYRACSALLTWILTSEQCWCQTQTCRVHSANQNAGVKLSTSDFSGSLLGWMGQPLMRYKTKQYYTILLLCSVQ